MAMVAAGFTGGEAEELRRAFGFKRSEKRMQQIEGKLRAGMARQGITGDAAEEIIRSITSFALYGFPESHAASFALLAYASAYLKAHYPAAFYTAHAQQPADGVLPPGDARQGRAAPRRPLRADRRAGVRLALPRRAGRPRPARPDVRQRACARKRGRPSRPCSEIEARGRRRDGSRARGAVGAGRVARSAAATIRRCSRRCTRTKGFCNICSHLWTLPIAPTPPRLRVRASGHDPPAAEPRSTSLDALDSPHRPAARRGRRRSPTSAR